MKKIKPKVKISLFLLLLLIISTLAVAKPQTPMLTNEKISLNFHDIPVRDLLELLAEFKHINLILSDEVRGSLTLRLENISWQQALDSILMMRNLGKNQQGSILIIGPIDQLASYSAAAKDSQNLTTQLIAVHYAKAVELGEMIQDTKNNLLSERGSLTVDPRTNTLWIKDTAERLEQVQQFLKAVDVPARQVSIAARIVTVDQDSLADLGIKFGTATISADDAHGALPAVIDDPGHIRFSVARLGPTSVLDLEIAALAQEGRAEIISKPELITANRQSATIESGQEIPYQQGTSSGATNVAFKKAVLGLKVTPEISPENQIMLLLKVNQDQVSPLQVNGVPAINTQEIETQVRVHDGETIVLGGIFVDSKNNRVEHIPFLGKIPLVGALFANKETHNERKELLIFITPKILN